MASKVKRGRRGQSHKATPRDLRESGPVMPVKTYPLVECGHCGGPVPVVEIAAGIIGVCLACGGSNVVQADDDCPMCATRPETGA